MAEVPYFIPNLAFNSWVWYSKFLIDEEALFFSRNDRGDLRKIRNIWEDVHKNKINYFAGIWIPDTSINSFVHLLLFKENNFLPSHSHVWQRTEIFPFPWEKLFLKVPMYSSKRLAKYQNLTKAKKRISQFSWKQVQTSYSERTSAKLQHKMVPWWESSKAKVKF